MKLLVATTLCAGLLLGATAALACAPLIATDPDSGESYRSGSPEWLRREQAEWRGRSEVVLVAQARAGRMLPRNEIEFTLAPIFTVYGGTLPRNDLLLRWSPGNTCNRFILNLTDRVVVYVGEDGNIVGVTVPEQLQDRPAEFGRRLREIARGILEPS